MLKRNIDILWHIYIFQIWYSQLLSFITGIWRIGDVKTTARNNKGARASNMISVRPLVRSTPRCLLYWRFARIPLKNGKLLHGCDFEWLNWTATDYCNDHVMDFGNGVIAIYKNTYSNAFVGRYGRPYGLFEL